MSNKITPNNPRFTEVVAGLLHELLRAAGVSMVSVKGQERVRAVAQKLTESIEYHAEQKAIEVAKILQKTIKKSFEALENTVLEQNKKLKEELEKEIARLKKDLQRVEIQAADAYRITSTK